MFIELTRNVEALIEILNEASPKVNADIDTLKRNLYSFQVSDIIGNTKIFENEGKTSLAEIETVKLLRILLSLSEGKDLIQKNTIEALGFYKLYPEEIADLLHAVYETNFFKNNSDVHTFPFSFSSEFNGNIETLWNDIPFTIGKVLLNVFNLRSYIYRSYSKICTNGEILTFYSWPHLLYAYLIENTRVYEIFQKVIFEFQTGEKLGRPAHHSTQQWLLRTEQLFYNDPSSRSIYGLTSYARADLRATRRNSYYRMFGMDLNHGTNEGKSYPYVKPVDANTDFVRTFEELLQEVWVGIEYRNASYINNPTDDGAIRDLIIRLQNMLLLRREYGNLSREEFYFCSIMQWFHMVLLHDFDIIKDLRANADTPDQRLNIIGNKVGMASHSRTYNFIHLADNISKIMHPLENGIFNINCHLLYKGQFLNTMETIITQWSQAFNNGYKRYHLTEHFDTTFLGC